MKIISFVEQPVKPLKESMFFTKAPFLEYNNEERERDSLNFSSDLFNKGSAEKKFFNSKPSSDDSFSNLNIPAIG